MKRPRYPHTAAGATAAAVFLCAGIAAGLLVWSQASNGPGAIPTAAYWGALAGIIAYLVFASQGPARPPSVVQAAAADGIVSGILTGLLGTLFSIVAASDLGGSTLRGPGVSTAVVMLFASATIGTACGAAFGLVVLQVGGRDRLARIPVSLRKTKRHTAKTKTSSHSRPGHREGRPRR